MDDESNSKILTDAFQHMLLDSSLPNADFEKLVKKTLKDLSESEVERKTKMMRDSIVEFSLTQGKSYEAACEDGSKFEEYLLNHLDR